MSEFVVVCPTCGSEVTVEAGPGPVEDDRSLRAADQTESDEDQTWADHDQTGSDRDQRSADEDQKASDEDLAAGGDPVSHRRTTSARARSSLAREDVSRMRDETAADRLQTAGERDRAAELDDRAAEERDRLAHLNDVPYDAVAAGDLLARAERDRARAAADRASAAADRARAAEDRRHAAQERAAAFRAGVEARHDLAVAAKDELTGAWTRKFGLVSIHREVERANRTGSGLVLAFIDVDGLKGVNDTHGHPAGDRLLRLVAEVLSANVRRYDVIVRYGGDEFLCAMPYLSREAAKDRMELIAATVGAADEQSSISFGLAAYEPGEELEALIARADANLLDARRSRQSD